MAKQSSSTGRIEKKKSKGKAKKHPNKKETLKKYNSQGRQKIVFSYTQQK